jgi:hypothetical protein
MILEVIRMAVKDILGGIFKRPNLRDIKNKIREKFGYIPMNDPSLGGYSKPIIYSSFMSSAIFLACILLSR